MSAHQPKTNPPSDDARVRLVELIGGGGITTLLQPIVNMITGEAIGYEALTRPSKESGFKGAIDLFDAATELGMLWELESVARERAIARAAELPPGVLLFVNSSPQTFMDKRFVPAIEAQVRGRGIAPARIVLEITERTEIEATTTMTDHVRRLKSMGYQVAIDDAGAGTSGLNRLMTLRPHWLKLDRELIEYIDQDRYKLNLIKFLVHFAKLSGVNLLAEGIERDEELQTLLDAGVPYSQGYALGKPEKEPQQTLPDALKIIRDRARMVESHMRDPRELTTRMLMRTCQTMQATTTIGEAASQMMKFAGDGGVVVVDGRRCLGWCPLTSILHAAGSCERDETIGLHVHPAAATLSPDTTVKQALELASVRDDVELSHPIIISDATGVCGLVPLRILLASAAAGQHEQRPADIMPVTGLPGRVAADIRLDEMIHSGDPSDASTEAAFVDLRSFADFNSAFGYELGDRLIHELSCAVRSHIVQQVPGAYLFHLGEDRFLIVGEGKSLSAQLERFVAGFDAIMASWPVARNGSLARIGPDDAGEQGAMLPVTLGVRVLRAGPLRGNISHPRMLYQLEAQLRQKSRGVEAAAGAGKSIIVSDDRREERAQIALRKSA